MEWHKGGSYMWADNEVERLLNITVEYEINKTQENVFWSVSRPGCSGRVDVHLSEKWLKKRYFGFDCHLSPVA